MAEQTIHEITQGEKGYNCTCGKTFSIEGVALKHAHAENAPAEPTGGPVSDNQPEAKALPPDGKTYEVTKEEPKGALPSTPPPPAPNADRPLPQPHDHGEVSKPEAKVTPPKTPPAQQPSQLATRRPMGVKDYLTNGDVQDRIKKTLEKRATQFTASMLAAIGSDEKIAACVPATVLNAGLTAASFDLPINNNLGFAYLIPYKNKKGQYECQYQFGWRGYIQLAQRSGQYKHIAATPVYEGQLVEESPLEGNIYDWKAKKSDTVIGYVSYFKLLNGFEKSLYMTVEQLDKHARQYSQSYKSFLSKGYASLWDSDFEKMSLKTVLKLLIKNFGPMSIEMQNAVLVDETVDRGQGPEYIDGGTEIQDRINQANTPEELEAILDSLSPSDKVIAEPMLNNRYDELMEAVIVEGAQEEAVDGR